MKPFGIIADRREYEQNYYGGYCNKVRELNLEPLPYTSFKSNLRQVLELDLTKKERMEKLIELTITQ